LNRNLYISAGFFITRLIPRTPYLNSQLLPNELISASRCFAPQIPDTWTIEWTHETDERRVKQANEFYLDESHLSHIITWITSRFGTEIGWPNICFSFDTAQQLVRTFLKHTPHIRVLELGLHQQHVQALCREAEPGPPEPGYAPTGRQGVHEAILQQRPIMASGNVLGFEPLVFEYSLSCSWLCNGLETEIWKQLKITPNVYGLIAAYREAMRCIEYISRDDVGAEPGLWLPWLLIDHSIEV
jgi:hypothetical protein